MLLLPVAVLVVPLESFTLFYLLFHSKDQQGESSLDTPVKIVRGQSERVADKESDLAGQRLPLALVDCTFLNQILLGALIEAWS